MLTINLLRISRCCLCEYFRLALCPRKCILNALTTRQVAILFEMSARLHFQWHGRLRGHLSQRVPLIRTGSSDIHGWGLGANDHFQFCGKVQQDGRLFAAMQLRAVHQQCTWFTFWKGLFSKKNSEKLFISKSQLKQTHFSFSCFVRFPKFLEQCFMYQSLSKVCRRMPCQIFFLSLKKREKLSLKNNQWKN